MREQLATVTGYNEQWEQAYADLVKKHEDDAKRDETEMQQLHAKVASLEAEQLQSSTKKTGHDEDIAKVKRELIEAHKLESSLQADVRQAREVNLASEAALQKSRANESKLYSKLTATEKARVEEMADFMEKLAKV